MQPLQFWYGDRILVDDRGRAVRDFLRQARGRAFCDGCLALELHVNRLDLQSALDTNAIPIDRGHGRCSVCGQTLPVTRVVTGDERETTISAHVDECSRRRLHPGVGLGPRVAPGSCPPAQKEDDVMDEKNRRVASTGTYRVRGVSRDLHRAARFRATREGTTLRWVVLQALQAYSAGTWTPKDEPPAPPASRTSGI